MTQVGFKKMNWYPKPSAWKQHVAQRQKRAENVRAFQAQSNDLPTRLPTRCTPDPGRR